MFRKGGLSRETGIMSGLDSPRRSYAGGGNIGGGSIFGNPMGSRTGFLDPQSAYARGWNKIWGSPTASTTGQTAMRWPWLSEKGLLEAGKKIAGKGAGIMSAATQRFPAISKLVSSPWVSIPGAAISQYQMTKPEEYEKEYGTSGSAKTMFPKDLRLSIANEFAIEYKAEIDIQGGDML